MRPRGSRARTSVAGLVATVLVATGCATAPPHATAVGPPEVSAPTAPTEVGETPPQQLPGWADEDHLTAFSAYTETCHLVRDPVGARACSRARELQRGESQVTASAARIFFETGFLAVEAEATASRPGLLTAYFAPEYAARRVPDAVFDTPVLAPPPGWVRGMALPERAEIEAGPPASTPLAWMRGEDLFFLQIQGSGYLTFENGAVVRAAYAADNGRPFVGIARPMAERGLLPPDGTSGEAIRTWLEARRGPEARAIMALNPRYIYFSLSADDGREPAGAAGLPLTARRSIAVDPASWAWGDLVWIRADGGNLRGARHSYSGLVLALDTGAAIRGPVRADLYLGRGDRAGEEAGAVRHPLRMWRLVPR